MEFKNLKNYMDRMITDYHVPGADCIVYKDHEMLFRYYTGFSDREAKKRMNGEELYIIFSMTKMLTCTCALQLFEKGCFMMSDPVYKYLPEFKKMKIAEGEYAQNPITIKDLFTMGAGLDYELHAPGIEKALAEGKTSTRELVASMAETVLGFEPGTRFRYSLCHDVLGALIEVWSGVRFGTYMKENVLDPLGMEHTFFGIPKDKERLSKMAAKYTYNAERLVERVPLACAYIFTDDYESGGAGLISTTEDYAIFLDAIANGGTAKNGFQILSPATVKLMGTNHLVGMQIEDFDKMRKGYGYGLGVRTHIDKSRSGSLSPLGEFGWDGAAGGFSVVDVKNRISLTYFQEVTNWDLRFQTEMRNALYNDLSRAGLVEEL